MIRMRLGCCSIRSTPAPPSSAAGASPMCCSPATTRPSTDGDAGSLCSALCNEGRDLLKKADLSEEDREFLREIGWEGVG